MHIATSKESLSELTPRPLDLYITLESEAFIIFYHCRRMEDLAGSATQEKSINFHANTLKSQINNSNQGFIVPPNGLTLNSLACC